VPVRFGALLLIRQQQYQRPQKYKKKIIREIMDKSFFFKFHLITFTIKGTLDKNTKNYPNQAARAKTNSALGC
jgi:hypothetical protein